MRRKFCILSPQRRSKRPKPAGNADFFKITDHLKPPTVAKRCTFLESRRSPALRGFVAGRWALATTSLLYPSTKIERLQRARNGAPRRCSSSEFSCGRAASIGVSCCFPTPLLKAAHRAHTTATGAFLWATAVSSGVGAGHARKCARLPLAASQVLCLPHPTVGKLVSPKSWSTVSGLCCG